jgi:hypothetical protein
MKWSCFIKSEAALSPPKHTLSFEFSSLASVSGTRCGWSKITNLTIPYYNLRLYNNPGYMTLHSRMWRVRVCLEAIGSDDRTFWVQTSKFLAPNY